MNLKELARGIAISGLGAVNQFPISSTKKEDVQLLISKLRPRLANFPLIRIGPLGDGGYCIPDDIGDIRYCFSPGVSEIAGFEEDCANRGMKCFLADASVDGPPVVHKLFDFEKKFIGAYNSDLYMTLESWVESKTLVGRGDLILQMDIEGWEYASLLSTSEQMMERFRYMVIEFHYLDSLWSSPFFLMASHAFSKILQTHTCVHIHPNNHGRVVAKEGIEVPQLMEFTFARNDRVSKDVFAREFPLEIDCPNVDGPDIELPRCWY